MMTRLAATAAFLSVIAAVAVCEPQAVATAIPRVVVYDERPAATVLLRGAGRRPGLGTLDGVLHQHPAAPLMPPERRAGKITAFDPTAATPGVVGLPPAGLERLLRSSIEAAPSHTVFLDELTADFRGDTGRAFRAAMENLAREPSPWGEENLARHLHIYIPTPGWMLNDPAGWGDAWRILALSGGVWMEAFRAEGGRPVPWAAEDWLSYPAAVAGRLRATGGDHSRLHFLIGPGLQSRSWRLARTGPNCRILANGPGAYRVGRDAPAFLDEFAAAFGREGTRHPRCIDEPTIKPSLRRGLTRALRLADGAVAPPSALDLRHGSGTPGTITVRLALGDDAFRLAERLELTRERFWGLARARVRVVGPGIERTARLPRTGRMDLRLRVRDSGPLDVRLQIDGRAVRAAIGRPASLARIIGPRPALPAARPRFVSSPSTWDLTLPLRTTGRGAARSTFEIFHTATRG